MAVKADLDSSLTKMVIGVIALICYGPSVISVTVTKGGHLRGGGLYKTSGTMGRGVTELRKKFSI